MSVKNSLAMLVIVLFLVFEISMHAWAGAPTAPPERDPDHTPEHQMADLGVFTFEDGTVLENLQLSYVTHGTLSPSADNVILALHPFLLDHHGQDFLIGPGKALDTDKYFIIAPDSLGNSMLRSDISTGPTGSGMNMDFPRYTFRDWIRADVALVREYLDFQRIRAIVGSSSGGFKGFAIATNYPDFAASIVPIAATPVLPTVAAFHSHRMQDAIELDPHWLSGNYYTPPHAGLRVALMNHFNWAFGEAWKRKTLVTHADIVAFDTQWGALAQFYDPRDVHFEISAFQSFSIGGSGDFHAEIESVLSSITAKILVLGISSDQLIPPADNFPWIDSIPDASYVEIETDFGHVACCGFDPSANDEINRIVGEFLATVEP